MRWFLLGLNSFGAMRLPWPCWRAMRRWALRTELQVGRQPRFCESASLPRGRSASLASKENRAVGSGGGWEKEEEVGTKKAGKSGCNV